MSHRSRLVPFSAPSWASSLSNVPSHRIPLVAGVTPLQPWSFSSGGEVFDCLIKRDDLTGLAFGGNKTRKLEFLVGQALAQGCDTLVTAGGVQSNHCRQTAAAAAKAGLKCELILNGKRPELANGNLLLDQLLGATEHWIDRPQRTAKLKEIPEQLRAQGHKPYVIGVGGSNGVGATGYVLAMLELADQVRKDLRRVMKLMIAEGASPFATVERLPAKAN